MYTRIQTIWQLRGILTWIAFLIAISWNSFKSWQVVSITIMKSQKALGPSLLLRAKVFILIGSSTVFSNISITFKNYLIYMISIVTFPILVQLSIYSGSWFLWVTPFQAFFCENTHLPFILILWYVKFHFLYIVISYNCFLNNFESISNLLKNYKNSMKNLFLFPESFEIMLSKWRPKYFDV